MTLVSMTLFRKAKEDDWRRGLTGSAKSGNPAAQIHRTRVLPAMADAA